MESMTLKLYRNGVHVGTEIRKKNDKGMIEVTHQNVMGAIDTRRGPHPIQTMYVNHDSFEIINCS